MATSNRKKSFKVTLSTLLLTNTIVVALTPAPAAAQEEDSLQEIVITARHREESLADVPISIAAFSGDSLAERQVSMTEALSEIAANVQFSPVAPSSGNNATSAIFIRGVGQTDFIGSTDPGVGFYVDGVYFAHAAGTAVSLLDIDRVEVLRGPQGTLFGRNTLGGAIQVIPNKPTLDDTQGSASASFGDYRRREGSAVLNLRLSDTLAIRLAALGKGEEGYVTDMLNGRDLGGANTIAARLSAFWKPTESFDLLWSSDYMSDHSNGTPTVFGGINTSALFVQQAALDAGCPGYVSGPVPATVDPRCPNNQYLALGPYKVASEAASESKIQMWGTALTTTWHVADWMTVKSITGYRETKPSSLRDADNTPLIILETINQDDFKQLTQEVQFLGDALDARTLHWQAGAYYFRETDDQFYPVYLPSQDGGSNSAANIKNESYALFSQESFDFTKQLQGTVGIRYTSDTKEATPEETASPAIAADGYGNYGYYIAPNPAPLTGFVCLGAAPVPASFPCTGSRTTLFAPVLNKRTDSKTTPMASLQYRWSPELMTYVSYSEGYKSGGFNTRIVQPVIGPNSPTGREYLPSFSPEQANSWEVGAKINIGQLARVSAALFDTKYKNIQIVVREGIAPVVQNAGDATIKGFEVEGSSTPVKGVSADFGVGYTDFHYDRLFVLQNAVEGVTLGDQQAYTPRWSANLGLSYRLMTGLGAFVPRIDGAYRSFTYFDAPNTPQIAQPGYEVYNASLRYTDPSSRYSMTAGVTNFTDRAYRVSGNSSLDAASGYAEVTYAPPRQWFVEGKVTF
jgi:iron complex outermembrane recepter protein